MTAAEGYYQQMKAAFDAQLLAGKTFYPAQSDAMLKKINEFYAPFENNGTLSDTERYEKQLLIDALAKLTSSDPVTSSKELAPYKSMSYGENIPTIPDTVLEVFNWEKWKPWILTGGAVVAVGVLGYLLKQINTLLGKK